MSSWFTICEKCNKPINRGLNICPHCGHQLSNKTIQSTPVKKSVRLNHLDGYEFEKLVEEIFQLN
ncbi:MAG: hypothetical protein ACTSQY_09740, partial [Candidatus Odinarchaeia archaeon]